MKRLIKSLGLLALVAIFAIPSSAPRSTSSEGYACPDLVLEAFTMTDEICDGTGRNQACYGHVQLNAEPRSGVESFIFSQEGDIEDVLDVQSLRLSAMDTEQGVWGVALMRLQANLPQTEARKNITLLLFGEVAVENAVEPTVAFDVMVQALNPINMRLGPTTEALVVKAVYPGDPLLATGRLSDSSWLRVQLPEDGRSGWIKASLLTSENDVETLAVVEPDAAYYAPMQAFYLQSGVNDAACPEAPNSGLLIQTPEGVAEVTFLINEVNIQLGSTVYFQAAPGGEMTASVIEGHVTVSAGGVTYTAVPGSQISIQLSEDGRAVGAPTPPQPYDVDALSALPLQYLDRVVTLPDPLTEETLVEELAELAAVTGDAAVDTTATTTTADGWQTAPGLDGAVPPGQGGTPPGQDDKDKDKK
jgi:uncharacterized protein YgiM (DUF1202 family)